MTTRRLKAVLTAEDRTTPVLSRVSTALKGLGAIAVAVGVTQIGRSLVRGFGEAVRASGRYEAATTRLAAVLRNQGQANKDTISDLLDFARATTEVSLATETQIVGAIAQAKAFGASTDAAKRMVSAATDLAAATGVDMETAFRQVNLTLGGFAGELGQVIPELKDLTTEQLRAGAAADILLEKFGGAGEAVAKTFTGSINNLNSALDQFRVTLGAPIREVLTVFVNELIIPTVKQLNTGAQSSTTFKDAIVLLGIGLAQTGQAAIDFLSAFQKIPLVMDILETGAGIVANRLTTIREGLKALGANSDEVEGGPLAALRERFENVEETLRGLLGTTSEVDNALGNLGENVKEVGEGFSEQVQVVTGEILTAQQALQEAIELGFGNFDAVIGSSIDSVESFGSTMGRTFRQQGVNAANLLGKSLVKAADEGKFAFDRFMRSLLTQMAQAIAQALLLRAILQAIGLGGGSGVSGGIRAGGPVSIGGGTFALQRGGIVPGRDLGRDSVLAALRPREMVLPRELTDFIIRSMNRDHGSGGVIELRVEEGIVADRLSDRVQDGTVRLVASELAPSPVRR